MAGTARLPFSRAGPQMTQIVPPTPSGGGECTHVPRSNAAGSPFPLLAEAAGLSRYVSCRDAAKRLLAVKFQIQPAL